MVAPSPSRNGLATAPVAQPLATDNATSDKKPDAECLLYTEVKAARVLAIGVRTLQRLRRAGQIKFVRIGGDGVRYYRPALTEWIETNLQYDRPENGNNGHVDN